MKTIIIILLFFSVKANAYPNFIGMGYSACINCHTNGAGGGVLTDYGRGLFASEIAAKPFWKDVSVTEDELSKESGFLGKTEMPWWLRPGYKYRNLYYQEMPGQANSELEYFTMQSEPNVVLNFDEQQKMIFVFSLMDAPEAYLNSIQMKSYDGSGLISREHYLRKELGEKEWLYVGLMDRVFGIRHPDHIAVNRSYLGLGQFDQVYAVQYQKVIEGGEYFIQPYTDHSLKEADSKASGIALQYERETTPKNRYGIHFLFDVSKIESRERMALTARIGVGDSSSALFEIGKKTDTPKGGKGITGAYGFAESQMKLIKGLYFQSQGEYAKNNINQSGLEYLRWGLGFIYFPAQRIEFRFGSTTKRIINDTSVEDDEWAVQSQMHLSL